MNHWQMIVIAYGLTFAALAIEVALLVRRRSAAKRQARASLEADGWNGIGDDGWDSGRTGAHASEQGKPS